MARLLPNTVRCTSKIGAQPKPVVLHTEHGSSSPKNVNYGKNEIRFKASPEIKT
jgi:hypothetical protein